MSELNPQDPLSEPLLEEKGALDRARQDDSGPRIHPRQHAVRRLCSRSLLVLLLVLSLIANIALLATKIPLPREHEASQYAGLKADLPVTFEWASDYANPNLTEAGKLWDAINFDIGMVALPNSWTDEKHLPRAQPFPWDHDQGLYVLNGHHALHCLKNIHRAIREYEFGLEQSLSMMHITHCLDALRSDIICQADDTPRYTTITKSPESAVGQVRQCRDWSKLEDWARERTSCYNYISHKADFINQFKRFQFCPKDSPYWPAMREHFGKPDDWFGDDFDEEVEKARTG